MPRDPKCLPTDPKFYGEFESELRSRFRARDGEIKGSGVSARKAITLRSGVLDQN